MSDCIFCKIASGEAKSTIVYSDENVVAFNDIHPQAPTHIVVIPKVHMEKLADLSDGERSELVSNVFGAIKSIVSKNLSGANGYRVCLNQGPDAGQIVPHIHFHLLSRRKFSWPPG